MLNISHLKNYSTGHTLLRKQGGLPSCNPQEGEHDDYYSIDLFIRPGTGRMAGVPEFTFGA